MLIGTSLGVVVIKKPLLRPRCGLKGLRRWLIKFDERGSVPVVFASFECDWTDC
jgi:hypothetical protein